MFPVRLLDLLELKTLSLNLYTGQCICLPVIKEQISFVHLCKTLILLYTVSLMINPAVVGNR